MLLDLYHQSFHKFFYREEITPECLDTLDQEYIFYLIYKGNRRAEAKYHIDKDHIHPRTLLERAKVSALKINSVGNMQLIETITNRVEKNGKELRDWINSGNVEDKSFYIARHLIPADESLWTSNIFNSFLR